MLAWAFLLSGKRSGPSGKAINESARQFTGIFHPGTTADRGNLVKVRKIPAEYDLFMVTIDL